MTKPAAATKRVFPPAAHEVEACPPHYWLVDFTIHRCRKCGEERQPPALEERHGWR